MTQQPDQWRDWLGENGAQMVLYARQFVPTHADAEDVAQEAFVRFWRSRTKVHDPLPYLYKCVRNCAHQWQRSQGRRRTREQDAARQSTVGESMFEAAGVLAEQRDFLEQALARISIAQREVLILKIWRGLTFSQIAAALDIPVNTAASRYRYALAALRRHLAEDSSR